ncbi:MAG: Asp-tRNA(Asn)/Glu-tRNA(Gln) amidotransferase subunit GatA, partial [Synergistaceae bacterium]|nr:Asp-tRNA(Asn)/Glu-tRNA(Gln) amidotransferase subunit GatA [Synergistaceae bacterium]
MELYELNLTDACEGVKSKKFSSLELFESCLNRINKLEPDVKALITLTADEGREAAKKADEKIAKGEALGALEGVPVILKDNLCTKGIKTTAGSKILGDWRPPYDATVWKLLREAGAVLMGKANLDE